MFSFTDTYRGSGPTDSEELRRIVALPRRDWRTQAEQDARSLTRAFGKGGQDLRPIQAAVLRDLADLGGAFCPIQVGGGKSLVTFLAPMVTEAKRPLLLVPAQLVEKTNRELETYRKHWELPVYIRVVSYEMLSRDQQNVMLTNYSPDLVMADECHRLKNGGASVTKKVKRYRKANPEAKFLLLSGTVTKRSIRDYAHLLEWALGNKTPLPRHWPELVAWASALDEIRDDRQTNAPPGALVAFLHTKDLRNEYALNPLGAARLGYQRRLVESPGVIASGSEALGTSLIIRQRKIQLPKDVETAFAKMRTSWETPDGHPFSQAVDLWRHCRELATGFFYKWADPRPPEDWLAARKEWMRTVRDALSRYPRLDSPLMVAQACIKGDLGAGYIKTYQTWTAIRDTCKPKTEAVWMHDHMVESAQKWASEGPGLIWVDQVAFARRLEKLGFEYYGAQALNAQGKHIIDADPNRVHVVSVASCSTGQNLQAFNRNLIVSAPPTGRTMEQLLGRTHRPGQEADEVTVDVAIACREQQEGFWNAVADARFIEKTTGALQKLCYADISVDR